MTFDKRDNTNKPVFKRQNDIKQTNFTNINLKQVEIDNREHIDNWLKNDDENRMLHVKLSISQ